MVETISQGTPPALQLLQFLLQPTEGSDAFRGASSDFHGTRLLTHIHISLSKQHFSSGGFETRTLHSDKAHFAIHLAEFSVETVLSMIFREHKF